MVKSNQLRRASSTSSTYSPYDRSNVVYSADGKTPERFIGERVTIVDSGCWIMQASKDWTKYRRVPHGHEPVAHRVTYEAIHGPVPDGCHIHHTCQVPACVNPSHLEALSPSEHKLEHSRLRALGISPPASRHAEHAGPNNAAA